VDGWLCQQGSQRRGSRHQPLNRAEKLARLDVLFREIASTSSSGDARIEKRLAQLRKELEEKRKKQGEAQTQQAGAGSRAEAVQYSSILSRLSKGIASIETEIKFTEIESGRQIVASGKEGFGEAAQAEDLIGEPCCLHCNH